MLQIMLDMMLQMTIRQDRNYAKNYARNNAITDARNGCLQIFIWVSHLILLSVCDDLTAHTLTDSLISSITLNMSSQSSGRVAITRLSAERVLICV